MSLKKNATAVWCGDFTHGHSLLGIWKMKTCSHKDLCMNCHSSFIYNSQSCKQFTCPSIGKRLSCTTSILWNRILLSNRKEGSVYWDTHNLDESLDYYVEWKKVETLHTVWLHLYNILEKTKLQKWRTD